MYAVGIKDIQYMYSAFAQKTLILYQHILIMTDFVHLLAQNQEQCQAQRLKFQEES